MCVATNILIENPGFLFFFLVFKLDEKFMMLQNKMRGQFYISNLLMWASSYEFEFLHETFHVTKSFVEAMRLG